MPNKRITPIAELTLQAGSDYFGHMLVETGLEAQDKAIAPLVASVVIRSRDRF